MKEISIGEFARRSRPSLRALRLYDERGALVPSLRSGPMRRRASLDTGATPKRHTAYRVL